MCIKLPEIVVLFRFDYYLIGDYRYFVRPSYKTNIPLFMSL